MWNVAAYEEYENSPAGISERLKWEREMLSGVAER